MATKPGIPKGTRDFSPAEVAKRQYIIATMKHHFETFGFQPIETPSFENSETLMGKYGEEGDRLIFKILDSGDYLEKGLKNNFGVTTFADFSSKKLKVGSELTIFLIKFLFKIREDVNSQNFKFNDLESRFMFIDNTINSEFESFFAAQAVGDVTSYKSEIVDFINSTKSTRIIHPIINHDSFFTDENSFKGFIMTKLSGLVDDICSSINKKYEMITSKKLTSDISEKALRYDLTVPFARYVVQHQNEIEFPFKRYQVQPVWRADRPQKGRFREFYQCDADVVGSTSLWQEVELVQLYDNVFTSLGLNGAVIKINNRKILSGIAEVIGAKDKLIDFTVALDKLDKVGEDGVKKEMLEKGITEDAIAKVQPLFSFTGTINEKLAKLEGLLATSEEGLKGVAELRFICDNVMAIGMGKSELDLDVTLARGLNYYTGAIFEVTAPKEVAMGSIGGGGRYDDLTGIFGLKNMSGVGISFGLDRIYLVLEELNLFPDTVTEATKVLFINFGDKEALYAMKALAALRKAGIKAELYPDAAKLGKQFGHADKRGIPFAVLCGDEEINSSTYKIKDLASGEQETVSLQELIKRLS